jgi:hypothetical protein
MMFKDFLNARLPIKSQASYVEFGYGQVEPNHLSAQRTAQIYAQLPAAADISILEQGQFVKYDYAANDNGIGVVNFTGAGEWMMVYNEIKLYRNHPDGSKQWDCEFAMIKDDYQARIYSPYDYEMPEQEYHNGLYLNGKDSEGNTGITVERFFTVNADKKTITINDEHIPVAENKFTYGGKEYEIDPATGETTTKVAVTYAYDDVTKNLEDIYEMGFTNDPWKKLGIAREKKMPTGTAMVPRVIKTNVGDIMTTNTINATTLKIGDVLTPGAKGILEVAGEGAEMKWQVVKLYTMPDGQKGVKVMRIA